MASIWLTEGDLARRTTEQSAKHLHMRVRNLIYSSPLKGLVGWKRDLAKKICLLLRAKFSAHRTINLRVGWYGPVHLHSHRVANCRQARASVSPVVKAGGGVIFQTGTALFRVRLN